MQAASFGRVARATCLAIATLGVAAGAPATERERVLVIPKTGARCVDDPNCHNRWHPAIAPVATASSGDVVVFGTRDAFDHSLNRNSTAADVAALNLNLVHPLTGPLCVRDAKAGDVLAITLLDVAPDSFGYTIIVPGFGFLRDVFPDPFIVRWELSRQGAYLFRSCRASMFASTVSWAPSAWRRGLRRQRPTSSARRRSPRPAASCCGRSRSTLCRRPCAGPAGSTGSVVCAPSSRVRTAATWT